MHWGSWAPVPTPPLPSCVDGRSGLARVLISLPTKWSRPPWVVVRTEITDVNTWRVMPQPNRRVPSLSTAVILRRAGAHAPTLARVELRTREWKVGLGTENEG